MTGELRVIGMEVVTFFQGTAPAFAHIKPSSAAQFGNNILFFVAPNTVKHYLLHLT
jgi:hypothetical protein